MMERGRHPGGTSPFVNRGRSLAAGALSVLSLGALGFYLLAGSSSPSLAARYQVGPASITAVVTGSAGADARFISLLFRDGRGVALQRKAVRVRSGERFTTAVSGSARSVQVGIRVGRRALVRTYPLRAHQSLTVRARFPPPARTLLPSLFAQTG